MRSDPIRSTAIVQSEARCEGPPPFDRLTPGSPHPQTCGCGVGEDYARSFGARPAGSNVWEREESGLQLLAVAATTACPASARVRGSAKLSFALGTCRDRRNNSNNNDSYPPYHTSVLASGAVPYDACAMRVRIRDLGPPPFQGTQGLLHRSQNRSQITRDLEEEFFTRLKFGRDFHEVEVQARFSRG